MATLSNRLPRSSRRDGHYHRRQLLRILQEGSKDANQLRGRIYMACARKSARAAQSPFPAYVLGQQFYAGRTVLTKQVKFTEAMQWLGDRVDIQPEGYATDRRFPDILYVPENADFSVREGSVTWHRQDGQTHQLILRESETYVLPWGRRFAWKNKPGEPHGALWHFARTPRCATSPALSPAAANRKFRSRLGA